MPLRKEDKVGGIELRLTDYSGHGTPYLVFKWRATGAWSCSCTGWIIHKAKLEGHTDRAPRSHHCKHIRRALDGELKPSGKVFLAEPSGGGACSAVVVHELFLKEPPASCPAAGALTYESAPYRLPETHVTPWDGEVRL
jgi:hypothetical protein